MFDGNNITYYESSESNAIGTVIEIELTGVRAVNEIRILTQRHCYGVQISRIEIRVGNNEVGVDNVDAMLSNLDWKELVGHHELFDATCFAISTMQKFQRLEDVQPTLVWKPLGVIKRTLQETTQ